MSESWARAAASAFDASPICASSWRFRSLPPPDDLADDLADAGADEVVVAPTDAGTDTAAATKPATRQRARAERRTSMGLSRVDNSSHTYNRGHNG